MKKFLTHNAILLAPGGGPTLTFMGAKIAYKVSSTETNGAWTLLEFVMPPHFEGMPLHWHKSTHTGFYILDGKVTFKMGAQTFVAAAGAFLSVPPDTLHAFRNEQDQPARMLEIILPSGFENYFKEVVVLAPTERDFQSHELQTLRALRERYDMFMEDER